MKISGNSFCPCGSMKKFKKCCKIFHMGENPKTALELMKSRYSAFVAHNTAYIMKTTHKQNEDYSNDIKVWEESISNFSEHTDFKRLEIYDFKEEENIAYVTFKATIFQGAIDISFVEKSKFLKEDGVWLYHSGEFLK